MRARAAFMMFLLSIACAGHPSPVPVLGTALGLSALSGEWSGEYRGIESGRSGSVTFSLTAGHDTAFGDVVMIPGGQTLLNPTAPPVVGRPYTPPQVLTIRFVRVSGLEVSGAIVPYTSPDCDCTVSTVFRGQVQGDRIEGTFLTRPLGHDGTPQHGTWWARRESR